MAEVALILGAQGRFGRNAAQALAEAGWDIRRFDRARDSLDRAARGADLIVNGWNPAYPDWAAQVPRLTADVIAAARASNATVVVPGNVYVFGPTTPPPWSEHSPQAARNPLGRIRVEMEQAYRSSGVRTILLRAGDFLDTEASGNWFDRIMIPKLADGLFTSPGDPSVPRAWAFLPDMARAVAALAARRAELPAYAEIPFPGYTLSAAEILGRLEAITGRSLRLKRMSWLPLQLAQPVWPMGRKLVEMRYLWDLPHWLDGRLFTHLLPEFTPTPVDRALAAAIPSALVR
ncbi:NAD-dependent epimerase/dehydratase family protein [Pseudodonghicola flavimaris]|uniref:Sugar nucleotide-binding protein n=1 Tax=Pseudodonghicola flavimaris TaxID=3050036 RepID=A0ABT7EWH3_9RHOB|nr:NAD-dependent epimerase/dehydratase family protein [Pseudodonghicola flavimaris]MDK3016683.1 sugar nucleotide-binding protein [Pseudodonghicola flavimaris]